MKTESNDGEALTELVRARARALRVCQWLVNSEESFSRTVVSKVSTNWENYLHTHASRVSAC